MTWIVEKFLSVLAKYWREALIISLGFAVMLLMNHSKKLTVEYQDKEVKWKVQLARTELNFATQVALAKEREDEATRAYAANVETIKARHAVAIKDIEKTAWKNYVARYGLGSISLGLVGGVRNPNATGVRNPVPAAAAEAGKDEGAGASDGASGEFISAAARDASRLNGWIELCQLSQCEVVQ